VADIYNQADLTSYDKQRTDHQHKTFSAYTLCSPSYPIAGIALCYKQRETLADERGLGSWPIFSCYAQPSDESTDRCRDERNA